MKVSELYIHPVKSCASVSVQSATLDELGFVNDRRWMLVDEQGQFVTQRFVPKMCLIDAEANDHSLTLSAAGHGRIQVKDSDTELRVTVWNDQCNAIDCGDDVASWLSEFLQTNVRLVRFPQNEIRQVDLDFAREGERTGFSDGFPLLLISQASLDDLNSRLQQPVEMRRFRPNIVIEGCDAYAEDSWSEIEINGIRFRLVKPCSRCSIPSINPATAIRELEPVKTLREYRLRDDKVYFGQNVIAEAVGEIAVGMDVKIVKSMT